MCAASGNIAFCLNTNTDLSFCDLDLVQEAAVRQSAVHLVTLQPCDLC